MRLRLIAGIICGVSVLVWRFYGCDLGQATGLIALGGYYVLAAAAIAALVTSRSLLPRMTWRELWEGGRRHRLAVMIIFWGSLFLHLHEPHLLKVTQDEPTHLVTSYVMHLEKTAQAAGQAHYVGDLLVPSAFYPSFRSTLFSFFVSLLHDLTGYRVVNVFILNGLLTPVLLWIAWGLGRRLGGEVAGCGAAAGLACFPLLGQVVTSGSYDILNLVLLTGTIWATLNYIRVDATNRKAWMDFSLALVVLLALSRYESIAYIAVWVGCVAWVWWRERTVEMSWFGVFSPLLLLPNMTANYITLATQQALYAPIKGDSAPFFALAYLPQNLADLVYYLFAMGNRYTNNPLVALVGVIGWAFFLVVSVKGGGAQAERWERRAFAVWALFIMVIYGVVLSSFWSSPLDDAATRFVLPLWWVLAIMGGWLVAQLPAVKARPVWVLVALFLGQLYVAAPVGGLAYSTYSLVGARADAWLVEQAAGYRREETLFVSNVGSSLIANKYAAVPIEKLENPARFVQALKARLYKRVLIYQCFIRGSSAGWMPMPGSKLLTSIRLTTLQERVLAGSMLIRLSLFEGYVGADGVLIDTNSRHPDVDLVEHFKNSDEATEYFRSLYP